MRFTDTVSVAGTRRTTDGYLVADARAARAGVQIYSGVECDPENQHGMKARDTVRVYRPEEQVFARDTLASFAHRPLTVGHPADAVTAATWKTVAVGHTGDEIARDGEFIRVPMMVADVGAIASIEAGDRELSAGYTCDLIFGEGRTPAGEAYDAVQQNIRANHIAIVKRGRAGSEVRIGDDAGTWGAAPLTQDEGENDMADTAKTRTVLVDGLPIETTDAGAAAIEKLTKDRDDARKALADAETAHVEAIKVKDKELGTAAAEITKLKSEALDAVKLDQLVTDRANVLAKAKAIAGDVSASGKSIPDIRRVVVAKKLGDAAVKDKSDDYVEALFDGLAKDVKVADPLATALGDTTRVDDIETIHAKRRADLSKAWQGPAKAA